MTPLNKPRKRKFGKAIRKTAAQLAKEFMAFDGYQECGEDQIDFGFKDVPVKDIIRNDGMDIEANIDAWLRYKEIYMALPLEKKEEYFEKKREEVSERLSQMSMVEMVGELDDSPITSSKFDQSPSLKERRKLDIQFLNSEGSSPIIMNRYQKSFTMPTDNNIGRPINDFERSGMDITKKSHNELKLQMCFEF